MEYIKTQNISARVPSEVRDWIDKRAAEKRWSRAFTIRELLVDLFDAAHPGEAASCQEAE